MNSETLTILTYLTLALSMLTWRFIKQNWVWQALLVGSIGLGLSVGRISGAGLLVIVAFASLFYAYFKAKLSAGLRLVAGVALVVFAVAIMMHWLPGFYNWKLLSGVVLNVDASPYSLWLNFDKALIGMLFLVFAGSRPSMQRAWTLPKGKTFMIAALGITVTIITAIFMGYIRLDPRWTNLFWFWAPVNLLFVCLSEEALFRGLVQGGLLKLCKNLKFAGACSVLVAGILFGLAHFAGGPSYVCLASIAGIFYGWVYWRSGSLELAVLTHFSLNTIHFLFFTYPAIKP